MERRFFWSIPYGGHPLFGNTRLCLRASQAAGPCKGFSKDSKVPLVGPSNWTLGIPMMRI